MRIRSYTTAEMERGRRGLFFPVQSFANESDREIFANQQRDLILKLIPFLERSLETKNLEGGFYVDEDTWPSYGMKVDIWSGYITASFLFSLIGFLVEHNPRYTVSKGLYQDLLTGQDYIGRLLLNNNILQVEKSVLKNQQVLKALKEFESLMVQKK